MRACPCAAASGCVGLVRVVGCAMLGRCGVWWWGMAWWCGGAKCACSLSLLHAPNQGKRGPVHRAQRPAARRARAVALLLLLPARTPTTRPPPPPAPHPLPWWQVGRLAGGGWAAARRALGGPRRRAAGMPASAARAHSGPSYWWASEGANPRAQTSSSSPPPPMQPATAPAGTRCSATARRQSGQRLDAGDRVGAGGGTRKTPGWGAGGRGTPPPIATPPCVSGARVRPSVKRAQSKNVLARRGRLAVVTIECSRSSLDWGWVGSCARNNRGR